MQRIPFISSIILCFVLVLSPLAYAKPPTFYVAMDGNDNWSGKQSSPSLKKDDGPFRSIGKARDAARALIMGNDVRDGIIIIIRSGRYELADTIKLSASDSGTEKGPVVYSAFQDEKVVISGGTELCEFKPYNGQILQVTVSGIDIPVYGPPQLFCDGQRMTPARWPNVQGSENAKDSWTYTAEGTDEKSSVVFKYNGTRPEGWKDINTCQVSIFPNYNWYHTVADVSSINPKTKEITLKNSLPYNFMPGRRFFFQNIFEELDQQGEWFHDSRSKVIYFYPPEKLKGKGIVVPRLDNLVVLEGTSHVQFKGLTFEACNGEAIKISKGKDVLIEACVIRNTGGNAVEISGGSHNGVVSSSIYDTGKGAIILSGGDRASLAASDHYALNNHIYKYGRIYKAFNHAVTITGVGGRLMHNIIHDGPGIAVRLYGNEHIVEHNEIYDVCKELADTGAIYIGRDWTFRGNIIRFNKIHDVYGFGMSSDGTDRKYRYETPFQARGIFLDDCASGTSIYGNIIYRVPLGGILVSGGNDNNIENNVLVDCIPAVFIGACPKNVFMKAEPGLQEGLFKMMGPDSIYRIRYPEIFSLYVGDTRIPKKNCFARNLIVYSCDDYAGISSMELKAGSALAYEFNNVDKLTTFSDGNIYWHKNYPLRYKCSWYGERASRLLDLDDIQSNGLDRHSFVQNPFFADEKGDDFRIPENSPLYKKGFRKIPTEEIGIKSKDSIMVLNSTIGSTARCSAQIYILDNSPVVFKNGN